jgi:LuxR family maltose regulon positive regulatory protein
VQYLTRLLAARAYLPLLSADARSAVGVGRELERVAERAQLGYARAWGIYLQALSAFHMHRLAEARESFLRLMDVRLLVERRIAADAMAGLALTHQFLGEPASAVAVADDLLAFAQEADDQDCVLVAQSCRARLALLQGDLETALEWGRRTAIETDVGSFLFLIEIPLITLIRIRIADGTERGLRAAGEMLEKLRPQLEAAHVGGHTIEVIALHALALERQGQRTRALELFREALNLAAAGEWARPFVEAPIEGMLLGMDKSDDRSEFVRHVADLVKRAVPSAPMRQPHVLTAASHPQRPGRGDLTNRELDILELAAQRLRSKEIAKLLHISEHTVKDHLKHIYQKLGVSNRRHAVAAAIAARIIG